MLQKTWTHCSMRQEPSDKGHRKNLKNLILFFFATPHVTVKFCPLTSQFPNSTSRTCGNALSPIVKEDMITEHLSHLHMYKSTGSDRMNLMVLKKLANISVSPLYVIFERSWHERGSQWLEKHHTYLHYGQQEWCGELQTSLLHLNPW